jgi:lysophospholipase L1-like esterase
LTDEAFRQAIGEYSLAQPLINTATHTVVTAGRAQPLVPPVPTQDGFSALYLFDGDSLTWGSGSTDSAHTYPSQCMALIDQTTFVNSGVPGAGIEELNADAATLVDTLLGQYQENFLLVWIGANDQWSASVFETGLLTYWQARRAAGWDQIIAFTVIKRGDGYANEVQRALMNTWIRANWATYCDALVDVDADTRLQTPTDETYFYTDHVHLNNAGYAVVAGLAAVALSGTVLPFSMTSLVTGCVDYFNLEEATGSRLGSLGTALDPTGLPARINGKVGYAVSLPTNAKLLATPEVSLAFNSLPAGYTIAGWFRIPDKLVDRGLFGKTAAGPTYEYLLVYRTAGWPVDRFEFAQGKTSGIDEVYANNLGSPTSNTWYFIVCWYDGTNIYIQVNNGTPNSLTATGAPAVKAGAKFGLGAVFFGGAGDADAVGFWSRVLTEAERTSLWNREFKAAYSASITAPDFSGLLAITQVLYPWVDDAVEMDPLQRSEEHTSELQSLS